MKRTQDNNGLQCLGLSAVLLMGSYGICGWVMAGDSASYIINWLGAVMLAAVIWMSAATFLSHEKQLRKTGGCAPWLISLYFVAASGLYIRGLIALWRQWALPQTPLPILALSAAAVAVFGGSRGSKPVLRLGLPVLFVVSFFYIMDTALLVPEMSRHRLSLIYGGFDAAFFLKLLGAMLLPLPAALLLPNGGAKGIRSCFRCGAAAGLAYLLLSAIRSVLLLGPLAVMEPYPLLRSLMLVYVGPSLNRMECWGLMALSAAMLTSAIAMVAGAISYLPVKRYSIAKAVSLTLAITALAFF